MMDNFEINLVGCDRESDYPDAQEMTLEELEWLFGLMDARVPTRTLKIHRAPNKPNKQGEIGEEARKLSQPIKLDNGDSQSLEDASIGLEESEGSNLGDAGIDLEDEEIDF